MSGTPTGAAGWAVAGWWQSQGLRVIPAVNWCDEASLAYCFDGNPPGQIVSIGVPNACGRALP
ncbi:MULTISPECIES: DUF4417 domain-containing protein [Halomonas]|uniref:DUF4417 domain-containing protein n=1 Tax=Halomonas TaxID=2745 RepID=UPI003898E3D8